MNIGAPPEEAQLAVREPSPEYARIYEGYSIPSEFPYKYEYDPALSKKLLAKAGFPNGIDIDLMANTNHLKTREAGRVLAGMLRKANIRVNLVQLSPRSFRNGFRKHRRKPAKGFKPFLFFNYLRRRRLRSPARLHLRLPGFVERLVRQKDRKDDRSGVLQPGLQNPPQNIRGYRLEGIGRSGGRPALPPSRHLRAEQPGGREFARR